MEPGHPLPPPSALKRKILIKNKRLKPEVEKVELELYLAGQFEAKDEQVEDASAPADAPKEPPEGAPPAEGAEGEAAAVVHTGSTMACHPFLSSMINYAQPIKFQGFDVAESMFDDLYLCT